MVLNNLGVIYRMRSKSDRSVLNFSLAADVMLEISSFMDSYQIFSLITVFNNLIYSVKKNANLEDCMKVINYSVLFMEKFESKIEEKSDKAEDHYSKLSFYSQFILIP